MAVLCFSDWHVKSGHRHPARQDKLRTYGSGRRRRRKKKKGAMGESVNPPIDLGEAASLKRFRDHNHSFL